MPKTASLSARIDPELKMQAEKILEGVGVTASQAITMFYRQVVYQRGIPFDVRVPSEETLAALREVDAGGGDLVEGDTRAAFDDIARNDQTRGG